MFTIGRVYIFTNILFLLFVVIVPCTKYQDPKGNNYVLEILFYLILRIR